MTCSVPISEEFIFRGVLLSGFHRYVSFRWANGLQAMLFALMHEQWQMAPFYVSMALITGSLRRRTEGLAAGVLLHALNNFVALYSLWPD